MQAGSLIRWQPISPASLIALTIAFWRIRSAAVAAAPAIWERMYACVAADVNPPLFAGEVADLDVGVDLR